MKTVYPLARFGWKSRFFKLSDLTIVPHQTMKPFVDKKTVMYGPFSGMKYPEKKSVGSAFYPKIVGSYEKELHPLIERLCLNEYKEIVDIGCAEGYYAIGLAMRVKTARVFAFETNQLARELCQEMAVINNVSDRLEIGAFCDANTLRNLPLTHALIICDCEGYEKQLFDNKTAKDIKNHEVIIEVHDLIDMEISEHLIKIFEKTHTFEIYTAIDDIKKAQTYDYKEFKEISKAARMGIFAEGRPSIMEWFYLKPKSV